MGERRRGGGVFISTMNIKKTCKYTNTFVYISELHKINYPHLYHKLVNGKISHAQKHIIWTHHYITTPFSTDLFPKESFVNIRSWDKYICYIITLVKSHSHFFLFTHKIFRSDHFSFLHKYKFCTRIKNILGIEVSIFMLYESKNWLWHVCLWSALQ